MILFWLADERLDILSWRMDYSIARPKGLTRAALRLASSPCARLRARSPQLRDRGWPKVTYAQLIAGGPKGPRGGDHTRKIANGSPMGHFGGKLADPKEGDFGGFAVLFHCKPIFEVAILSKIWPCIFGSFGAPNWVEMAIMTEKPMLCWPPIFDLLATWRGYPRSIFKIELSFIWIRF